MSKLNQYRAFVAIAENGSLAGAAKALVVSASSVSKQLSKLESDVGTQLVDRSTHAMRVTQLGEEFYHRCKSILQSVQEAERNLQKEREEPSGKLTLTFSSILMRTPLLILLKEFSLLYPNIKFDFKVSSNNLDLVDKNIDFAFRIGELEDSNLVALPLGQTNLIFVASPEYLQEKGKPRFSTLLTDHHVILPSYINGAQLGKILNQDQNHLSVDARKFHSTDDGLTIDELAKAGLGVIFALDISVVEAIKQGKLIRLFPKKTMKGLSIHLAYHRRDYMPANMLVFKTFIKERFPKMIQDMRA